MNPNNTPQITESFDIATQKFQYKARDHIGSELFRELAHVQHYERVRTIIHTFEGDRKITKGFL